MSRWRGGIITNLDRTLSPEDEAKAKAQERRQVFIDERIKAAERTEREGVGDVPDTIYTGLQRGDVYTSDAKLDNDPDQVRKLYQLRRPLPVKQREIEPDGTYAIRVAPEFVEALKQRLWCHTCEEPQPDNDIEWGAAMLRLEERLGPRPAWAAHYEMCPYCGAKLGLDGDFDAASSLYQMTGEQKKLLEEMFGPIAAQG